MIVKLVTSKRRADILIKDMQEILDGQYVAPKPEWKELLHQFKVAVGHDALMRSTTALNKRVDKKARKAGIK